MTIPRYGNGKEMSPTDSRTKKNKADEFEVAYLADIHERVNMAIQSFEKLVRLIARIQKDCGDE